MRWSYLFYILISWALGLSVFAYDWSTNPGNGSEENPYQISEPSHLISIGSDAALLDKHFILTNDIVFDPNNNPNHVFTTALIAPELTNNWDCFFTGTPFSGTFDGNDHIIKNMHINSLNTGNDCLGLIGCISTGQIKNVIMENCIIIASSSWAVGCVCGYNKNGIIDSCISEGSVTGTSFSHSLLCGENSGIIKACDVTGNISIGSDNDNHGGICGYNYRGSILNCSATVSINANNYCEYIGGICGTNKSGLVSQCNAISKIKGLYQNKSVGGICGRNEYGNVKDCISKTEITGGDECGRERPSCLQKIGTNVLHGSNPKGMI